MWQIVSKKLTLLINAKIEQINFSAVSFFVHFHRLNLKCMYTNVLVCSGTKVNERSDWVFSSNDSIKWAKWRPKEQNNLLLLLLSMDGINCMTFHIGMAAAGERVQHLQTRLFPVCVLQDRGKYDERNLSFVDFV